MKISTKGRYALRMLIDMAEHDDGGYITLKEITSRQALSEKYLESIISVLVKAGVLVGQRGKGGGYKLLGSPEQYTVAQILRLTEGGIAPVACLECKHAPCPRAGECKTLILWRELNRRIDDYLSGVTIADLMYSVPDAE